MKWRAHCGMVRWIISLTVLFLLSAIAYNILSLYYQPLLKSGQPSRIIDVKPNTSAGAFVATLTQAKLVSSRVALLGIIRLRHASNRIKAGLYRIKPGQTAIQLLNQVLAGEVVVQSFRIVEGSSLQDLKTRLSQAVHLKNNSDPLSLIAAGHASAEGLLLADTYYYDAGSDAKPLLELANQQLMRYLQAAWEKRSPDLPYKTSYELLTAASIIEKETAALGERALISGVIVNRLRLHMPLQMDPTVIYALGSDFSGKLAHADLKIDSPYNTYLYRGLPPTPIAMVGREAIDAAAHPTASDYLYFYAKGDGTHQFSRNYTQQKEAINQFKK